MPLEADRRIALACSRRLALALLVTAALALLAPAVAWGGTPGEHVWADTVYTSGIFQHESAVAAATDAAGYPIIVGNAVTSLAGGYDIRYRSYDLTGMLRWNAVGTTWDNPANPGANDTAAGVVVDDVHNCAYVAGTTEGVGSGRDIVILKVQDFGMMGSFDGELLWAQTFNATANGDDEAEAIALDKYGNVYVTGGSQRADGTTDIITVKYRPSGVRVWAKRHNNSTTRFDRGLAVAVRGTAVYVAGVSNRAGHRDDIVVIRYSLSGERKWVRYYDDALNRHDVVSGIAPIKGGLYVCGGGKYTATQPGNALLIKYLSDGTRAWVRWVAGSGGLDDSWTDVAADDLGRPRVTGYLYREATGEDIVTRMYTAGGTLVWQRSFSNIGHRMDVGTAVAVGGVRTYVCGFRTGLDGDMDVVALKYAATGATLWTTVYPDPSYYLWEDDSGDDWAVDIALAPALVYVAGLQTVDHGGPVDADFLTLAVQR
ncbi:MAG: hypothetical protein JW767_04585 [Thermoleophilia bacterium]|nr:hypothetical protein [Thermoleophilia bacterium]